MLWDDPDAFLIFDIYSNLLDMDTELKNKLISIAEERQTKEDPSHDFQHILRVLNLAAKVAESVGADLDVVIPAALFHDTVIYKKNSPQSKGEADESAQIVEAILESIEEYPKEKIDAVKICIKQCSFSKGIIPDLLESKVLQDADRLEATGAISIMRTFASSGQMNRPFYSPEDPFCENGHTDFRSGIDLFYRRLLVVERTMHTEFAKNLAKKRTQFLEKFLEQVRVELVDADIISK